MAKVTCWCATTRLVWFIAELVGVLVAIGSAGAVASAQTTVTLSTPGTQINADVTIRGGSSGLTDFSASKVLASKISSESYTRRIMLKFETEDSIPPNAVIQSARLYLVLQAAESRQRRPLKAFRVNQSFTAGETNWFYFRAGDAWETPGGDLGPGYGTTYVDDRVGSTYTFDLTEMVQRTVNGEFGSRYTRIAIVDTGALARGNYRAFHSTRAADAARRPRLVITYGSATTRPPPPPGRTIRVLQWNIHKTKGSDNVCNPNRIASQIVAQKADVISLNEVNFFSGQCAWTFDMGERLQSLLQQKTGVTWYREQVNVNGGSSGYGNVLLSRFPPVTSSSTLLSNQRGVAQMGIDVNGRTVNIFSTHIEYDHAAWRPAQIAEAVRWMNTFAEPRIAMGDFNTNPGTSDYHIIATVTQDAWAAAVSAGTGTSYKGSGATHGTSRFDYVFFSKATLALKSVNVPDTHVRGIASSDHDPVVAVFKVP